MFADIPDFFVDDIPSLEEQALARVVAFSVETSIRIKLFHNFLEICDDFRDLFGGPTDDLYDPFGNELYQTELLFDDITENLVTEKEPEIIQAIESEPEEITQTIATKRKSIQESKQKKHEKKRQKTNKKQENKMKKQKITECYSRVSGNIDFWKTLNRFKIINIAPTPIPQKRFKHNNAKINYWTSVLDWVSNGQENRWHSRAILEEVYGKEKYHNFRAVIINKPNSLKKTPEYPILPSGSEPFKNTMLIAKFDGNWYFMYWVGF